METYSISAERRTILGKNTGSLRRAEQLPAVVYGHGKDSVSLTLNQREFQKLLAQAGESSLVDLKIDNEAPVKVLIHDVQLHPVTDAIVHADFLQVNMSEKVETEIALKFEGESKAVSEQGGILVTNLEEVKVECLPADLVHEIIVPLDRLEALEDQIRISDLKAPKGITILEKPDTVIAVVTPPRSEEELKALDSEVVENVESVETAEPKAEPEAGEAEAAEPNEGKKE